MEYIHRVCSSTLLTLAHSFLDNGPKYVIDCLFLIPATGKKEWVSTRCFTHQISDDQDCHGI